MDCIGEFIFQARTLVSLIFSECMGLVVYLSFICLIIIWYTYVKNNYVLRIDGPKTFNPGETVHFKGNLFLSKLKYLKWQKFQNGMYIDIDINSPKYTDSTEDPRKPILVINNPGEEDEAEYRIVGEEISLAYSNTCQLKMLRVSQSPSVTLNALTKAIVSDDCVELKATISSTPPYSRIVWYKGSTIVNLDHDGLESKYAGSSSDSKNSVLRINNVTKDDEDDYKIEVYNDFGDDKRVTRLRVIGDIPEVDLKVSYESQPVKCGYTIILVANVISRPPPTAIHWKKNKTTLHQDNQKYMIDNSDKLNPKLIIFDVDFDDSEEYFISVRNALGTVEKQLRITVEENRFICISGPVVVSYLGEVRFRTIFPPHSNASQAMWMKKTGNASHELTSLEDFTMDPSCSTPTVQCAMIKNVQEKGEYSISFNNMMSNKINVFIEDSDNLSYLSEEKGNYLRFFELQSVSRMALKIKLDRASYGFADIWKKFTKGMKGQARGILPKQRPNTSDDLDVTLMYAIFRNVIEPTAPKNAWGRTPTENDTTVADDIERIRIHRNEICHISSFEMTTDKFNESVLDLIGAIRRLSWDDEQLIKQIYEVLNIVFTPGEAVDDMIEEIKTFQKEAMMSEDRLKKFESEKKLSETSPREIRFHHMYDSSIALFESGTVAMNAWNSEDGICFMNLPMVMEENIFIHSRLQRRQHPEHSDWVDVGIGLTNKNPKEIRIKHENLKERVKSIQFLSSKYHNHACISLKRNGSLHILVDDELQDVFTFPDVSINDSLWLFLNLKGFQTIQISKQKPAESSMITDLLFSNFFDWCSGYDWSR